MRIAVTCNVRINIIIIEMMCVINTSILLYTTLVEIPLGYRCDVLRIAFCVYLMDLLFVGLFSCTFIFQQFPSRNHDM